MPRCSIRRKTGFNPGPKPCSKRFPGFRGLWLGLLLSGQLLATVHAAAPEAPIDKLGWADLTEAAAQLDRLHALVVAVDGEIIYGRAFRGPSLRQPVNIKSLSKTVLSAVVGAAIDRNVLESTDQPITDILEAPAGASPRLREVTIGNLLSLQAGLERTSGPNYGPSVNSDNWVDYALSRPFKAEPGGRMLYSTGSTHLLSAALTKASGRSTLELTRDWLGQPLDIRIPSWPQDPQGIHFGGNDMRLSPLALVQIGELYRNGGQMDGVQVIPKDWVRQSWQPRGQSRYTSDGYGYGWFITRLAGHRTYYGRGFGGQMLYVIPDIGVTAVITADPTPPSRPYFMRKLDRLLVDFVIPALE
ncbi:serine hydrolase domain-containing protein [Hydrocarboniclastica marina]|uniref:Class C beta-lactamase-related serine hydrolase n=1 Tax=Hydrocarboniclastica marina TaxID=2259620 RepID=A0A4P7XL99_9ALTE|nr:serine hydrolase [Hydrocarboniclastica marina]QCF26727.1 class C beta-lactamase-related serine hydrolase [Hydrocarboniclastica marina]